MAKRLAMAVVACAVVTAGLLGSPSSALSAAEQDGTARLQAGRSLPSPEAAFYPFNVLSASGDYVMVDLNDNEASPYQLSGTVLDAVDGSVVRSVPLELGEWRHRGPFVTGSSYLTKAAYGDLGPVQRRSVRTGDLIATLPVTDVWQPSEHWVLAPTREGAVFAWDDGSVVRTDMPGPTSDWEESYWSEGGYVAAGDVIGDAASGVTRHVTRPDGSAWRAVGLAHGRLFGTSALAGDPRLEWLDEPWQGEGYGSVPLPPGQAWAAAGRGAVVLRSGPQVAGKPSYELLPIDLDTGEVQPPLLNGVVWWRSFGHGRLGVLHTDGSSAWYAVIGDEGIRWEVAVPRLREMPVAVGLSGDQIVASWREPKALGSRQRGTGFRRTSLGGTWTPAYANAPRRSPASFLERFDMGGRAVLDPWDGRGVTTWPDGHQRTGLLKISRNGKYSLETDERGYAVRRARTGKLIRRLRHGDVAFDGRWLWRGPDEYGRLHAVDLTGRRPDRDVRRFPARRPVGPFGATLLEVRGGFALVYASHAVWLLDLKGDLRPWRVPWPAIDGIPRLGSGFVAWVEGTYDRVHALSRQIRVADLTRRHRVRTYGPVVLTDDAEGALAVNVADRPDLVFIGEDRTVHHVALDWLGTPRS